MLTMGDAAFRYSSVGHGGASAYTVTATWRRGHRCFLGAWDAKHAAPITVRLLGIVQAPLA